MGATPASPTVSLNQAWTDVLAHRPTLLLTWLLGIGIGIVSWIVGLFVTLVFGALEDGSGMGITLGIGLSWLAQIPFLMLQSLVGVLFTAIPAIYYQRGEVITFSEGYRYLMLRLGRYIWGGVIYGIAITVGTLLCLIPGIAIGLVMPVYVNKIFTSDDNVITCLKSSFSAVYGSEKGWTFVAIQLLAFVLAVVTCGFCLVGLILYVPVVTFFLQLFIVKNGLVRKGLEI